MGHGLSIRGDSLYCPLSFSLASYGNCLNDCWHCYFRRLNYVWGQELKPTDTESLRKKLQNGLKNPNPKSSLAWAIKQKKTLRWGDKTDPFQPVERKHRVSQRIFDILIDFKWPFVLHTMCTGVMMIYESRIVKAKNIAIIQPVISPGAEKDWEILERKRTTPIGDRFAHMRELKRQGVSIAVNGEPFIPGFHTLDDFENMMKRLKSEGIDTYNTYNFHWNDFVAKRLVKIGVDIEAIWEGNQDKEWKKTQKKLCELANKYRIYLGCPDFVNTGQNYVQQRNTCCGVNVSNPTLFNAHIFKYNLQNGKNSEYILEHCWDGVGDREEGKKILTGEAEGMYTMADAGFTLKKEKKGGFGFV
jgi:DNA repair photolyase